MSGKGTLHLFCGKMAAGKSTKAAQLADQYGAILLSEDAWLRAIYPQEIQTFDDYIRYSARLKPLLKGHVQNLLRAGLSVVLDFPGNTLDQRNWFKEIFSEYGLPHQLHYIKASDALCLSQLNKRSRGLPEGTAFTTEEAFHQVNRYFQPPSDEEGFHIQLHATEHT